VSEEPAELYPQETRGDSHGAQSGELGGQPDPSYPK
jgi:hypothetical protein